MTKDNDEESRVFVIGLIVGIVVMALVALPAMLAWIGVS